MKKRVLVSAGVVALLAGGVAAVAVAGPEFLAAPRADATDVAPFDYPVNDAGQTYGSLADAPSELLAPDLVLVRADDGREGYVRIEDLRAYEGEGVPLALRGGCLERGRRSPARRDEPPHRVRERRSDRDRRVDPLRVGERSSRSCRAASPALHPRPGHQPG